MIVASRWPVLKTKHIVKLTLFILGSSINSSSYGSGKRHLFLTDNQKISHHLLAYHQLGLAKAVPERLIMPCRSMSLSVAK
jgi:hypothetical protein